MTQKTISDLSYQIIGAAIEVHKELGPGLLERVYEVCFCDELIHRGLQIQQQVWVPVNYKGRGLDVDLKLDVLVEDTIVCELKTVEYVLPVHQAQLMTYMKLLQKPKGLLINFYTDNVKSQMKSFVNTIQNYQKNKLFSSSMPPCLTKMS